MRSNGVRRQKGQFFDRGSVQKAREVGAEIQALSKEEEEKGEMVIIHEARGGIGGVLREGKKRPIQEAEGKKNEKGCTGHGCWTLEGNCCRVRLNPRNKPLVRGDERNGWVEGRGKVLSEQKPIRSAKGYVEKESLPIDVRGGSPWRMGIKPGGLRKLSWYVRRLPCKAEEE